MPAIRGPAWPSDPTGVLHSYSSGVTTVTGDATLAALPGPKDTLEIIYEFEAGPPIGRQTFSFRLGDDDFRLNGFQSGFLRGKDQFSRVRVKPETATATSLKTQNPSPRSAKA